MRNEDVLNEIKSITRDKVHTRFSQAYSRFGSTGKKRNYDIIHSVDGLTVYVGAELGRKINSAMLGEDHKIPVTLDEQKRYNEEVKVKSEEFARKNPPTREGPFKGAIPLFDADNEIFYYEGILIDNKDDKQRLTAKAEVVLVEYTRINLDRFDKQPAVEDLIGMLKEKYDIQIRDASDGERDRIHHDTPGIISTRQPIEIIVPSHFAAEVRNKNILNRKIYSVYHAGKDLENALETERTRLRKYVGSSIKG